MVLHQSAREAGHPHQPAAIGMSVCKQELAGNLPPHPPSCAWANFRHPNCMLGYTDTLIGDRHVLPWRRVCVCACETGVGADDITTNYWNNFLPPVLRLPRAKVESIVMKLLKALRENRQLMTRYALLLLTLNWLQPFISSRRNYTVAL